MNIDDRQLDEWLGDVEVPADLAQRLMSLPDSRVEVSQRRRWPVAVAATVALAAAVGGIWLVVGRIDWTNHATIARPTVPPVEKTNSPSSGLGSADSITALEDIQVDIELLDLMVRQQAVHDLSSRVDALAKSNSSAGIESNQRESLIISLSDQSAFQLGASLESVERDMARVIERFPRTSGADLAEQFIAQRTLQ